MSFQVTFNHLFWNFLITALLISFSLINELLQCSDLNLKFILFYFSQQVSKSLKILISMQLETFYLFIEQLWLSPGLVLYCVEGTTKAAIAKIFAT